MVDLLFDDLDKKLINLLQSEFPLTEKPYATLGLRLGVSEHEAISRIDRLKAGAVIRMIGPVLDAGSLGYRTMLVAMSIAKDKIAKAEQIIAGHPGVSHGYERDHRFNLWFTFAASADLETELKQLVSSIKAEAVFSLPAVKVFKIGAYFDMDENGQGAVNLPGNPAKIIPKRAELSTQDKLVIRELQQDLPLVTAPFTIMSGQAGMGVEDFLVHCHSLLQLGIMRRFGASINHNNAGFKANSMTCWITPPDKVDAAGHELAHLQQVSHCYERKSNQLWPYNLFAMIHGRSREECQKLAKQVSHRINIEDCVLLFSTREFKKTRVKYLV